MFWYAISMTGEWDDEEDIRVTDDRGWAVVAMTVLNLPVRVVAK